MDILNVNFNSQLKTARFDLSVCVATLLRIILLSYAFLISCTFAIAVDECEKCDVNGICVNGHCKCRHGYIGNGYQCERGKK